MKWFLEKPTAACRISSNADDWKSSFKSTSYAKSINETGDRKLGGQTNYSIIEVTAVNQPDHDTFAASSLFTNEQRKGSFAISVKIPLKLKEIHPFYG